MLYLGKWLADELLSLYIATYHAMLPQVLKAKYEKEIVRVTESPLPAALERIYRERNEVNYKEIEQNQELMGLLQKHIEQKDLQIRYKVKNIAKKKYRTIVMPTEPDKLTQQKDSIASRAVKQLEIINYFIDNPDPVEERQLLDTLKLTRSSLTALYDKQILNSKKEEVYRNPYEQDFPKTEKLTLTTEQNKAIKPILSAIDEAQAKTVLLHGVTGSGKTEISLQAIEQVIQKGEQAIGLVPEIALTPQMVKRFKGRFGSEVAVLHSALSIGEKYDEWRKVQRNEVSVVVGARSAVFAPFENLGIIIIDEEHETTYKQEESPRYHAREVAIKRGEYNQCPVILGSDTFA